MAPAVILVLPAIIWAAMPTLRTGMLAGKDP